MNKLVKKSQELLRAINENGDLDRMEKQGQADADAVVARGDIENPREQKKLADARLMIDLAQHRRRRWAQELPRLQKETAELLGSVRSRFNKLVRDARERLVDRMVEAVKPFYQPQSARDLKGLRRDVEGLPAQMLLAFRKHHSHAGFTHDPTPEFVVTETKFFIRQSKQALKVLVAQGLVEAKAAEEFLDGAAEVQE